MVAAESFHRHNLAGLKVMHCLSKRLLIAAHNFITRLKKIVRPTPGTRHGLRVKTPICRVAVLSSAVVIQCPTGHGCIRSVVGKASNHAVTRTAVCAIDIRVVITTIIRAEKFLHAVLTNRQVGRNLNGGLPLGSAFPDLELRKSGCFRRFDAHFVDGGGLRCLRFHLFDK